MHVLFVYNGGLGEKNFDHVIRLSRVDSVNPPRKKVMDTFVKEIFSHITHTW